MAVSGLLSLAESLSLPVGSLPANNRVSGCPGGSRKRVPGTVCRTACFRGPVSPQGKSSFTAENTFHLVGF